MKNNVVNKDIRQSNFELLRIFSMFIILMSHCDEIFGLSKLYSSTLGINKIITDWLHIGGQIGVGCFLLISGYFMVEQKFSFNRLLKLLGEVWFYTISIWLVWLIFNIVQGGISIRTIFVETVHAFFSVIFGHYWFVTAYVILMILSPFINKFIFSLDRKSYIVFLIVIVGFFVVIQNGFPFSIISLTALPNISDGRIIPVFIMYFIAGYIKRFRVEKKNNAIKHLLISLVFYIFLFTSFYMITFIGLKLDNEAILNEKYFYRVLNSPLIVIIDVEMFLGILETNIPNSKFINTLASCTFGVYLIHSNRLVKPLLCGFFPIYKMTSSFYIFSFSLLSIVVIYISCSIIDFIRIRTFGGMWNNLIEKHARSVQTALISLCKKNFNKIVTILTKYYNET